MFQNLSKELSSLLAANKVIPMEHIEIYAYGLELFLFKLTFYLIVLIIALLCNSVLVSLVFLVSFMSLRQYTGGYHCRTSGMCMTVSLLLYLCMLLIYHLDISKIATILIVLSILSFIIVLFFSPIENKNKKLDSHDKKIYHIIALIISMILLSLSCLSYVKKMDWLFYPSSYSLTADAVMIILSLRRCKE